MLTSLERNLIYRHAYLPEHLPNYVEGISGAEPHLHQDHLCFSTGNHLIFIGYPLRTGQNGTQQAYKSACERFHPLTVAVIAPRLWLPTQLCENQQEDTYYRLDLPVTGLHPDTAYMIRRAARELQIEQGQFGKEHKWLAKDFLSSHRVTQEQKFILEHISNYLKRSKTARVLEARKGNNMLVAFTIVDLDSANYAFYLFNFRSTKENVPGASDLLFHEMVKLAQSAGKKAINLGLGINPGNRRFKEKWGGVPFLPYTSCVVRRQPAQLDTLLKKL